MAGGGVNGMGVLVVTAGAILAYAGLQGESPLDSIRGIVAGGTPRVTEKTAVAFNNKGTAPVQGPVIPSESGGSASAGLPELADALAKFKGDKYSMVRRFQPGYSDCSSFVGKGLKSIGITPPGGSTTPAYAVWGKLRKVKRSEVQRGDFLVYPGTPGHMAIALDNANAIGQQNSRRNVQVGNIERNIMFGHANFMCLRYVK